MPRLRGGRSTFKDVSGFKKTKPRSSGIVKALGRKAAPFGTFVKIQAQKAEAAGIGKNKIPRPGSKLAPNLVRNKHG